MNRNTPFRFRQTIVLGLVVATALVAPTVGAAMMGQPALPPGATPEPTVAEQFALPPGATLAPTVARQFALPPGATLEPTVASQPALPPGATLEPTLAGQPVLPPGATLEPTVAPTEQPGSVEVTPSPSSPVVVALDGFDWTDAGMGAGIALGSVLLLGGALVIFRRSGQRQRLALH